MPGDRLNGTWALSCPEDTKNNGAGMPLNVTLVCAKLYGRGTPPATVVVEARSFPKMAARRARRNRQTYRRSWPHSQSRWRKSPEDSEPEAAGTISRTRSFAMSPIYMVPDELTLTLHG